MVNARPASVIRQRRQHLRRDPNSLVASAAVMTGTSASKAKMTTAKWQAQAWDYYDDIGELRFGVNWLASALSRVNLVAAAPPESQGAEPIAISEMVNITDTQRRAMQLVSEIAGGSAGQGQLLGASARHLTVPGVGYILATANMITDAYQTWRMLSTEEVRKSGTGTQIRHFESGEWEDIGEFDLLIKVWRAHPRFSWEPDSPVRSVLSSLREIDLLSKRVAADATSRLAGNGLLIIPEEAEFPPGQATGGPESDGETDEFIQTLLQVMETAVTNQESVGARVPLVVRMPGEFIGNVQHIKFWTEFDGSLDPLRTAAVKRLALGLDMPAEVLLGLGDSNHWSAWQVAEEAITLHVEPLAETVCHALTIGFLRAALSDEGLNPDEAMVWYDTTDLTTRPDRTAAASEAHARVKISDAAYLREIGLSSDDLPDAAEERKRLLLAVASGAPSLAPAMLAELGYLDAAAVNQAGAPADVPAPASTDAPGITDAQPPGRAIPSEQASVAGLVAAADGLVVRALEKAGQRLRAAAGKGKPGGSLAIECDDVSELHTVLSATEHASLDHLLAGAWDRTTLVGLRYGVSPHSLTACLDGYTRALLASGHPHDWDRLAVALGATDADRHDLVSS